MKEFKIRVTPEQSKIVQERLFGLGYTWSSICTEIKNLNFPFLVFKKSYQSLEYMLFYEDDEKYFLETRLNEITFEEFLIESDTNIKEYILCAANYYNNGKKYVHKPNNIETGFIICGRRHRDCLAILPMILGGYPYTEEGLKIKDTEIKGFLTNTNRFVDRKEAYDIAFKANQIIGPNKGYPTNEIGLTSEDLY